MHNTVRCEFFWPMATYCTAPMTQKLHVPTSPRPDSMKASLGTNFKQLLCSHLLANIFPLAVELVQQLLDVDGERRLGLLLEVEAHLVDAVDAGLDGVDVVHQRLVSRCRVKVDLRIISLNSMWLLSRKRAQGWSPCTVPAASPELPSLPAPATPRSGKRPRLPSTSSES